MRPDSAATVAFLAALIAIGQMTTVIYLPSLPTLVDAFSTDIATVQLTMTVYLAALGICPLVYGPLSDRFGRRPVLIGGLAIYAAASVGCAFAPDIQTLIVCRGLQAVGVCSGQVTSQAIARDVYDGPRMAKVFGIISIAQAITPGVGPTVGGHLHVWFGWQANFVLMVAAAAFLIFLALTRLPETNRRRDPHALTLWPLAANFAGLVRHRGFFANTLASAFCLAALFAYLTGSPFLLIDRLGVRPDHFGILSFINVSGFAVGAFLSTRLVVRVGAERLARIGAVVMVSGAAVLPASVQLDLLSVYSVVLAQFVFSVGMGLILSNALALALADFRQIGGTASALLGCVQMMLAMVASALVSALTPIRPLAMIDIYFVSAILAALTLFLLAPSAARRAP